MLILGVASVVEGLLLWLVAAGAPSMVEVVGVVASVHWWVLAVVIGLRRCASSAAEV
jgi:hypothetical protein